MKRTITFLSLLVLLASTLLFNGARAEENGITSAEEWGMINGELFFTGDDGEIFTVEPNASRVNDLENVTNTGTITVVQDYLGTIENGGTVLNGVMATLTIEVPEGNNYIFVGNTYGCNAQNICTGTWMPSPQINGADGCTIVNTGQSTQMHCSNVGASGQTITITGRAVKPAEAPPISNLPYITIATNPDPSGGGSYTEWFGSWGTTLNLPIITVP